MGELNLPETLHAFTALDTWHGPQRCLLPRGSEIGVVLAPHQSSPSGVVWEVRAMVIAGISPDFILFIASNPVFLEDHHLSFDTENTFFGCKLTESGEGNAREIASRTSNDLPA